VTDERFMARALELAEGGRFSTSPNPMVGCVVVQGEEIIGEGFHLRAGEPHAEIAALAACRRDPAGATVYVSLEPCAHEGRTPPCTRALVDAKVARVVVATRDPNREAGGGVEILRDAGIAVDVGCLQAAARRLNEKFLYAASTGRPFVLLKSGMSLDGKLATVDRRSHWITSEPARERSLRLREEHDAILVGAGTIAADDPQLSRRLGLSSSIVPWTRVVVDSPEGIPRNARVLTDGERTLLFTGHPDRYHATVGLELRPVPFVDDAIDLEAVLDELGARGIRSVIAEGGSQVHTSLINCGLWQKMMLFVAPLLIGGREAPAVFMGEAVRELDDAHRFRFDAVERVGPDILITAYPD
jgi:diaminohydroxyphosphoribosylaminopyrimidine deaminase / 5-amino-6-(5-phosphoribosylamino)uracil reductase